MAGHISLLKISQHELGTFAPPELRRDGDFLFCVGRACLPHCIEAGREVRSGSVNGGLEELIGFLASHGAHTVNGNTESRYYRESVGWIHAPLADRERLLGHSVVLQNLVISSEYPVEPAVALGRVRSEREISLLQERMKHGGTDKSMWINAIRDTLDEGGSAIPLIAIPASDSERATGHSVLVTAIEDGVVSYFDPDMAAIERYEVSGLPVPGITRAGSWTGTVEPGDTLQGGNLRWMDKLRDEASIIHGDDLMYTQPIPEFVGRMSGELIHVFDD